MTKKEAFLQQFDNPQFCEVTVCFNLPDCPVPEKITNVYQNFQAKKAYYDRAYNDDLQLIANPAIGICGYAFVMGFEVTDANREDLRQK